MEVVIDCIILIICGLSFRIFLSICGQNWVQTYHHTISFLALPIITYIITKVISGNIALSLGMVGALSIIRFRTPVKNPLELVMYFALITTGIAGQVKIIYGVYLVGIINSILLSVHLIDIIFPWAKNKIFPFNYSDGRIFHTAEITSKVNLQILDNNSLVIQSSEDYDNNLYFYKVSSINKKEILNLINELDNEKKNIKNITINYN